MSRTTQRLLPIWPERLLRRVLPDDDGRETILGDLHEEHTADGRVSSVRYTLACLRLTAEYALVRVASRFTLAGLSTESVWIDTRQSIAALRRSRTYTVTAVATLALGIATITTMATIVYGALLRPLPFRDPQQLVRIGTLFLESPGSSLSSMAPANLLDVARASVTLSDVGAYSFQRAVLSTDALTERALGATTTGNLLAELGVTPVAGRVLTPADGRTGAESVVVIGEKLWQRFFARDPAAVGQTITIDLMPHTIVGVVPASAFLPGGPEFWTTFRWTAAQAAERRRQNIEGIGRLREGASVDQARAELRMIATDLARLDPANNGKRTIGLLPFADFYANSAGVSSLSVLKLVGAGAAVILLVSLINVTTLTIGRAEQRRRDASIHRALGASGARLLQRRVIEAVVIAMPAAAVGLGLATWLVPIVIARFGDSVPRAATIAVDEFSVWTAVIASAIATLVLALSSRLKHERHADSLRTDTRTMTSARPTTRRMLVTLQIGLAATVLYGALVVGATLWSLARIDLGVPTDHAVVFELGLPTERYASPAQVNQFFEDVTGRLRSMPGVEAVGITSRTPFAGGTNGAVSRADDPTKTLPIVEFRAVSPGFFAALGLTSQSGRVFAGPADRESDVAVISASLAKALFGEARAIGEPLVLDADRVVRVIGVVPDFRDFGPARPSRPTIYLRHGSRRGFESNASMSVIVRGGPPVVTLLPMIRTAVRDADPAVPVDRLTPLATLAERAQGVSRRAAGSMLTMFTGMAILLGAIGIAGVVAFNVQRRRREIGVRLALGATPSSIVKSVLREGLALSVAGSLVGVVGILWINQLLTAVVVTSITPGFAWAMAGVVGVLGVVALLASALPARRAARVNVIETLRAD